MKTAIKDYLQEYWDLKDELFYPFDEKVESKNPNYSESIRSKRVQLGQLRSGLVKASELEVDIIKQNLIKALQFLLDKLISSEDNRDIFTSSNQNSIIPGLIFGKVIENVKYAVKTNSTVQNQFIYKTYRSDDALDTKPLIHILERYKLFFEERHYTTYIEFDADLENLLNEIRTLWRKQKKLPTSGQLS